MELNSKKFASYLSKNDVKKQKGYEKERELTDLFTQAMSFKNTSEVDFSIFTPEKILEIAEFAVSNGQKIYGEQLQLKSFIKAVSDMPHVHKRYGCL